MSRIVGFPPVAEEGCRRLILGSMPSVRSLHESFYYAHPKNAFWRIVSDVFGVSCTTVEEKKQALVSNGFALWDVLFSCEREGSLDSKIRSPEPNDFAAFFARFPGVETILFNGAAAEKLFLQYAKEFAEGRRLVRLPSTSPAYTAAYQTKLELWRRELEI